MLDLLVLRDSQVLPDSRAQLDFQDFKVQLGALARLERLVLLDLLVRLGHRVLLERLVQLGLLEPRAQVVSLVHRVHLVPKGQAANQDHLVNLGLKDQLVRLGFREPVDKLVEVDHPDRLDSLEQEELKAQLVQKASLVIPDR